MKAKNIRANAGKHTARTTRRRACYDQRRGAREGKVKLLVFDMGHVFVDFEWQEVKRLFCQRSGRRPEAVDRVFEQLSELGYESGRIGTTAFLSELNRLLNTDIGLAEFTQMWTHTFRENEEMAQLLQNLKKQLPIYLLSNTNEIHYNWLQERFDVARHFEKLILSYQVGCSKPLDPIYNQVLALSGLAPEHVFFVDDLEKNIATARRLRWKAHQFAGISPLKSELRSFGLSV